MTKKTFLHAYAAFIADYLMTTRLEQDDGLRLHAHHALTHLGHTTNVILPEYMVTQKNYMHTYRWTGFNVQLAVCTVGFNVPLDIL